MSLLSKAFPDFLSCFPFFHFMRTSVTLVMSFFFFFLMLSVSGNVWNGGRTLSDNLTGISKNYLVNFAASTE